jgi:hypothetical protein
MAWIDSQQTNKATNQTKQRNNITNKQQSWKQQFSENQLGRQSVSQVAIA